MRMELQKKALLSTLHGSAVKDYLGTTIGVWIAFIALGKKLTPESKHGSLWKRRGSFGEVYTATNLQTMHCMAVKVMRFENSEMDISRQRKEIDLVRQSGTPFLFCI